MKLLRYNHYNITGGTIESGFPEKSVYIFSGSTPSDYTDITSIENLDQHGFSSGKDYKFVRDEIKLLFTTWSAHTSDEQLVFCKHKIGTQEDRNSRVGVGNAILLSLQYDGNMVDVRQTRLGYAKTEIHSRLPNDSGDILDTARDSILDYLIFGREGTVQGDNEGVTDYLNSVVGSGYETTGLSVQSYTPIGMSLTDLIAKVEDIILNGNY